ncbi:MAG TPA: adenosylcobinamide-GDP ribazoletransferase, partial [Acidimicrobiales bacterium]|nr:adenosylcobinamide-GDP ribazoletransferase [Acidimicrobiales bacterium]
MRTSAGPGRALVQAVSFLTCLGRAGTPGPGAVAWFPVVGAGVGLAVGGVWWGAARLWPPLPAAVLAVAADLVLTNLLHVDGLADAADGLLPHLDRERRLAVMAEPTTGAFGVAAVATVLVARTAAMASTRAVPLLVAALWCLSRTAMAVTTTAVPYARPGGLATRFIGSDEPGRRGRV